MAGKIKHRFQTPVVDEAVATEVGPSEWNDSLVMSEGADGDVPVRRTSAADGWELIRLGAAPTWVNVTTVNNSGTAETDLHSYTIPAGHFAVDKKAIRLKAWGTMAANANTKTLRLKFGATPVTVVLNPGQTAPNGLSWSVEVTIVRTGSNAQVLFVRVLLGTAIELISVVTGTETDANALTLKLTGQSAVGSNDITIRGSMVEYLG